MDTAIIQAVSIIRSHRPRSEPQPSYPREQNARVGSLRLGYLPERRHTQDDRSNARMKQQRDLDLLRAVDLDTCVRHSVYRHCKRSGNAQRLQLGPWTELESQRDASRLCRLKLYCGALHSNPKEWLASKHLHSIRRTDAPDIDYRRAV